ncbi:MAG: GyrI-like domain-containing protein [Chloroflexota bacterium]
MVKFRLLERPGFEVVGKKAWIGGQDNELFGRFWRECQANGLLATFWQLRGDRPGPQTGALTLGISRVEQDPNKREFFYMLAVEKQADYPASLLEGMETYTVPATRWAVFECRGKVPESIVKAEMFAFMEWLPTSGYEHALAPEMEVYPNLGDRYCEFWLPIRARQPERTAT